MDGITFVRVVRQIRVVSYGANIQDLNTATPLIAAPQLAPPPNRNNRCLNAFILLIIYTIGIGSIVIGAMYLKDCPVQRMLPEGLVIFGGLFMVARLLNCVYDFRSIFEEEKREDVPRFLTLLNVLFGLVQFGMFIAVSYWTFSIDPFFKYQENGFISIENYTNYCDYTLYKTSFYGCITGLVFFGFPILCLCCIGYSNAEN